ncbi:MAG: hypothetical protein GZ091_06545 [Paludibacter sp.]|nr:hypothetical protein [Paludibacter sp.]
MAVNTINKIITTSTPLIFAMATPMYPANSNFNSNQTFKPSAIQFSQPLSYKKFQQQLAKIYCLRNNWDGKNACEVDLLVYSNTNDFLSKIDSKILDFLNEQSILPTPYGTITLDFEKNNNLVSIEIGETQIGFFTDLLSGENISADNIDFPKNKISGLLKEVLINLCDGN